MASRRDLLTLVRWDHRCLLQESTTLLVDRALVTFAKVLHKTLRESDLVARIGGDEFAALLLDTPKASALDVILRLQARLDVYNDQSVHDYKIDFSFGVVDFDPQIHPDVEALLADGDAMMYECKQTKS